MDINDIKRFSGEKKIPVGIIEKDYVLSIMLSLLANCNIRDKLIFKGGTAIKKMYFSDARFSIDLDFNFNEISIDSIKREIVDLIQSNAFDAVEFVKIKNEFESKKKDVYRCMIEYKGPIKHTLNQSVRLDFNSRESLFMNIQEKRLMDMYGSEMMHVTVPTMNLAEIFAEKCKALITRKEQKSKDLFDIHFLLNKNVDVDKVLIDKKLKSYRERFNEENFNHAVHNIESVWNRDLQDLITNGNIPDINQVKSFVHDMLCKTTFISSNNGSVKP